MIFLGHVKDQLAPYVDRQLDPHERNRVDAHLARCETCRISLEQVRRVGAMLQSIPLIEAPESIWNAIEAAADRRPEVQRFQVPAWAYATALILVVIFTGYWARSRQPAVHWEIAILTSDKEIAAVRSVPAGEWIETPASSRARIRVGDIGSVDVEPNTRIRLGPSGAAGHRLELGNGAIRAKIAAPPRLFFVDTPAGTAVDLGCEYQIRCDRTGDGILNVAQGWVSFEWRGAESLVPAGASCRMRPGRGPGTPWFDDAPGDLVEALERFDAKSHSAAKDLDIVLARSRSRDTLTLWNLLSRVEASDRARIFQRMIEFAPPPAGVVREDILKLSRTALTHWKDELAWTW
ncbi:MAG TPA: zf-HC2 domain-containing protein [Bryobacteraceae bacterium]|nr:zf-HC2 domain-containing protein [Bryobacteraceae bacterium]